MVLTGIVLNELYVKPVSLNTLKDTWLPVTWRPALSLGAVQWNPLLSVTGFIFRLFKKVTVVFEFWQLSKLSWFQPVCKIIEIVDLDFLQQVYISYLIYPHKTNCTEIELGKWSF